MIPRQASGARSLWWQERAHTGPLSVGEFVTGFHRGCYPAATLTRYTLSRTSARLPLTGDTEHQVQSHYAVRKCMTAFRLLL